MLEPRIALPGIAVLGGSFNPPHIGHFRLGLEVYEALKPQKVLLVPAAKPPHKPSDNLLPFDLRVALLQACVHDLPDFYVSEMEAERQGPSYTIDTLEALYRQNPSHRLCFILGVTDFGQFKTWHRWKEITALSDLVVVSRENEDLTLFTNTVKDLWPDALESQNSPESLIKTYALPDGGAAMFAPMQRLDISSSDLRRRWLAGESVKYLVPPEVEALLADNAAVVAQSWQKEL